MDLVLRNNRTSDEHPDGIFHPHAEIHPVKRENIRLIEVMGLAVLPGRLEGELETIARALLSGADLPKTVPRMLRCLRSCAKGIRCRTLPMPRTGAPDGR